MCDYSDILFSWARKAHIYFSEQPEFRKSFKYLLWIKNLLWTTVQPYRVWQSLMAHSMSLSSLCDVSVDLDHILSLLKIWHWSVKQLSRYFEVWPSWNESHVRSRPRNMGAEMKIAFTRMNESCLQNRYESKIKEISDVRAKERSYHWFHQTTVRLESFIQSAGI
jgi:hypothetical protein